MTCSTARLEANRRNTLLSTGPKTAAGKDQCRKNALKHGLTGDGVAIHGSNVREGAATHGCIGIPSAFAAKLFDVVRVGDPVMILPSKS